MIMAVMVFMFTHFDFIKDLQADYEDLGTKVKVTLRWELPLYLEKDHPHFQKTKVVIFRGKGIADTLDAYPDDPNDPDHPNRMTWQTDELQFGAFQYTVMWVYEWRIYDYKTGILSLGRLTYKIPTGMLPPPPGDAGFYVYLLEDGAPPPPPQKPPVALNTSEIDPADPFSVTEVPLYNLFEKGLIGSPDPEWLAAATWLDTGLTYPAVSILSEILEFQYVDKTVEIPDFPLAPQQPVIVW